MGAARKKPNPDFEVRLVGRGLRPWIVPMRALTRALNAVQMLMEHTGNPTGSAEFREDDEEDQEDVMSDMAPLHLIGVVSGSAAYKVAANDPEQAIRTLSETGRNLRSPDSTEWGAGFLSPIERLSRVAKSLGCSIEFKRPGRGGEVLARITPESYTQLSEGAFVTSESSVYAYLERVGGATEKRCGLRLPNQPRMVYCRVQSADLVRQLGQHIYQDVLVRGDVTWFRRTWLVRTIMVKDFQPAKEGSIIETLDRIYDAGGKSWEDVEDPEALIGEMRGE